MILQEIFELLEGVKFTTRQIEDVKKMSNDVLVGIEYEYNVDDDYIEEMGHTAISQHDRERFQEEYDEMIESTENEILNDWDANDPIVLFSVLAQIYKETRHHIVNLQDSLRNHVIKKEDLSPDEIKELAGALSGIAFVMQHNDYDYGDSHITHGSLQEVLDNSKEITSAHDDATLIITQDISDYEVNQARNAFIALYQLGKEVDKESLLNADDYEKEILTISDDIIENKYLEDIIDPMKEFVNGGYENPDYLLDHITQSARETAEEHISSEYGDLDSFIEREMEERGSNVHVDAIEFIGNLLFDNNKWNIKPADIREVKPDASVPDGVETVTKPLPITKALDVMDKMFDHIQEVGTTAENTGMHVNISIKNEQFNRHNFNPIKLIMLMDNNEILGRYPVRDHVEDVLAFLEARKKVLIEEMVESKHAGRELTKFLHNNIDKIEKYQGFNFNHLFGNYTSFKNRRVEFRFFGGDGYEERYKEMSRDIYRAAYMTMAAFDPDFLNKEYLRNIMDVIDKIVKDSKFQFESIMTGGYIDSNNNETQSSKEATLKFNNFNELRSAYLKAKQYLKTKNDNIYLHMDSNHFNQL